MKLRPSPVLLSLLLQLPLVAHASAEPRAQSPRPELVEQIDALAAERLAAPGGVGLSIAVAQHGKVLLAKGYGQAHAELDVPADEETMFRIGSVTKQFTAALILRLVEQEKLALDDELAEYVPEFP